MVAWKLIRALPEELNIRLMDTRIDVEPLHQHLEGAVELDSPSHVTVSAEQISACRLERSSQGSAHREPRSMTGPLAAHDGTRDGIRFEVSDLQLREAWGRKHGKERGPADKGCEGGKDGALGNRAAGVNLLRPCGMMMEINWKVPPHEGREGELVDVMHLSQIQPLFSMTGDPVELVLQPSILLTLMGVLYELESLSYANLKSRKDSYLFRPRHTGVASDGGADPA